LCLPSSSLLLLLPPSLLDSSTLPSDALGFGANEL
jgi:hypothetical protein